MLQDNDDVYRKTEEEEMTETRHMEDKLTLREQQHN